MNRFPLAKLSWSACLAVGIASALAADPPKPATPAAAPATPAAAKPAPKPAAPSSKRTGKAAPAPPPDTTPPQASIEQIQAANQVLYGTYDCEFNQKITVERNARYEGYVDLTHAKLRYVMKPVVSPIGAIRLEDVRGKTLMVQIAYKSMLLDVQIGQRLVDDCVHDVQVALKREADKAAANAAVLAAAVAADAAASAASAPAAPVPAAAASQPM